MVTPLEDTTVQKYDLQFGTNVIGMRVAVYPLPFLCIAYEAWSLAIHRPLAIHKAVVTRTFCGH
jgi:hypothetical protein